MQKMQAKFDAGEKDFFLIMVGSLVGSLLVITLLAAMIFWPFSLLIGLFLLVVIAVLFHFY